MASRFKGTLAERLERDSMPEPNSGCVLWTRGVCTKGYGHFSWNGKDAYAHQAAYELANGPIPAGMQVRHNCDVPSCLNPAHLKLGTHADNMADKRVRQRQPRGLKVWNAKLSNDDVRAIRADRRLRRVIAAEYGVAKSLVTDIINRVKHAHVPDLCRPLFVGVETSAVVPAIVRRVAA